MILRFSTIFLSNFLFIFFLSSLSLHLIWWTSAYRNFSKGYKLTIFCDFFHLFCAFKSPQCNTIKKLSTYLYLYYLLLAFILFYIFYYSICSWSSTGHKRKLHWHAKRVLHIFLKFVCLVFSVRKVRQLCKLFTYFNEKLKNSVTLEKAMSHASPLFAKASHL